VAVPKLDAVRLVFEVAQVKDLASQPAPVAISGPALVVLLAAVGHLDCESHECVPCRRRAVAYRDGAALRLVCPKQMRAAPALYARRQCPAQPDRVADAGVHPVTPIGDDLMRGIACEPDSPATVAFGHRQARSPLVGDDDVAFELAT